jgi:hypothetical protein
MATEHLQTPPASTQADASLTPITELHDPRAIQILSTEHWSMLTARSLAYNSLASSRPWRYGSPSSGRC